VRRIHIKYALDDDLKEERQHKAKYFYSKAISDPDWLKRVFFVDECAINLDHEIDKGVHVYLARTTYTPVTPTTEATGLSSPLKSWSPARESR
jgi:hypothetical protein